MRALVLDDDPAIGRLVRAIADPVGFHTELTTDACEFRSSYKTGMPDVVVLDLQIGATDGVEQLRFLSREGYRNPLVLMSGFDDRVLATTEHLARSMGLRAVAALSKPLRAADLARVLEEIKLALEPVSENQVLDAVRNNELLLEYQPIVSRDRTTVRWLEALARWDHPRHGRLAPDRFVPIAERSVSIMDAFTDWVVGAAARQHRQLRVIGLGAPIAVNVSGKNLNDITFPDRLYQILQEEGVPAGEFCVELTETAAALDPAKTMDILARLRLKGIHVALDDFGTGYSSLKQLRQLPFSALKIDRSFIVDLATSRDSMVIVKSIIDLARNLELETVAEGVETEEVATRLAALGADGLQGYLIARPLPPSQLAGWLHARSAARGS